MYKYIKNFVCDSIFEIFQVILLISIVFLPLFFNCHEVLVELLNKYLDANNSLLNITIKILLIKLGDFYSLALASIVLIYFVRPYNSKRYINKGNLYHNKPYWWYWMCSKILNYNKCNLILTPIYMQYKLVIQDTFCEYFFDKISFQYEKRKVFCDYSNKENKFKGQVNLIISDTYPINKCQIPYKLRENYTIALERERKNLGERIYSKELINKVVEEVKLLEYGDTVNIFSTTNPKNTYEIAKKAFVSGGRNNIKCINVFQQLSTKNRAFKDHGYKIL
ncbi:hypothetical protein A6A19_01085 [Actinobacillus delphinicola]|uniref:hypothetical protein n=1 Tax=Actinobacillus delphinicola TaxID=51161 RepID=UPI00244181D9|nr:hypothetical protein [Actinobacillus delphinicola]MDG6896623.1 hypothetical protein [Actinobacillus delphinicola]